MIPGTRSSVESEPFHFGIFNPTKFMIGKEAYVSQNYP